ncbi:MAG: hypothetical protein ABIO44_05685, partial [Saprospiraceae bacterium]
MIRINILFIFFLNLCSFNLIQAQCAPASSESCELSNVICSLDELNGYSCKNTEKSNSTGCKPLCPSGGVPNNTSWWAFVTQGGNVCLNFKISNCSINGDGIQIGLYGDCNCNESIICNSTCNFVGINQLCGILSPCKTYYLYVDGCSGDVCDFEISIPIGGSGSPG